MCASKNIAKPHCFLKSTPAIMYHNQLNNQINRKSDQRITKKNFKLRSYKKTHRRHWPRANLSSCIRSGGSKPLEEKIPSSSVAKSYDGPPLPFQTAIESLKGNCISSTKFFEINKKIIK